jgi:hypothetical protein
MKKILFASAALGLGLGLAASVASAEMSFSASGKYFFEGRYVSNGGPPTVPDGEGGLVASSTSQPGMVNLVSDSEDNDFMYHLLYTYPTLKINDNTSLKSEIRFIDRDIYGSNGTNSSSTDQNIWLRRLWMEYASPVGTLSIGRMPGGAWGSSFLDFSDGSDRIKLVTNFMPEPFGMTFIYEKNSEGDGNTGHTDSADSDSYYVGVGHKADFGKTDVALWHTRLGEDAGDYDNTHLWVNTIYKFGMFNLDTEWRYIFGDNKQTLEGITTDDVTNTIDVSSLGVMANAYTNIDAATVGLLFFYLQGDDNPFDDEDNGAVGASGVGNDYNPFLIATGDYTGLLNADKNGYWGAFGGVPSAIADIDGDLYEASWQPGVMALAIWGKYAFNDKLTFNAAFGQVWANELPPGVDDDLGMEFDIGFSYKLLDNLSYSLQFGYLIAGGTIDDAVAGLNEELEGTSQEGFFSSEDVFMLLHNVSLTF